MTRKPASRRTATKATTVMSPYERVMAMVALGTLAVSVASIIISMVQTSAMRQELKWKLQQKASA